VDVLEFYSDENRIYSNMYSCIIHINGKLYRSSEHWYQCNKTLDPVIHEQIRSCRSGYEAKKLGNTIEIRPDWDDIKLEIMYIGVYNKFKQNPKLRNRLLATDDGLLVENNKHKDSYWGVYNGIGENHLGKILMRVRDQLRKEGY
jgi:ribA/ribD-fused uncharacterized protein